MVEQQRARVEKAMNNMLDDLEKTHLRRMQADMHRCAAACCDDYTRSHDEVQYCVEDCSQSLALAHKFIHGELTHFQDRLQRCVMQCNDEAKDRMSSNPSESEIAKGTRDFEACATKCVDTHIGMISNIFTKIKTELSSPKFQIHAAKN